MIGITLYDFRACILMIYLFRAKAVTRQTYAFSVYQLGDILSAAMLVSFMKFHDMGFPLGDNATI